MVQSLGISVGNSNSYVAAGQGGGIEILLNEYSNRSTPSMVAFTDHSRSIGVDASSNHFMNVKNTIFDLMVLLGKPHKELVSNSLEGKYPFKLEEADDGLASVVVRHLGEERKFTIEQVLAMLFTKLRGIAYEATDCVISCPQFFEQHQKAALAKAALIAGLNPLQIISDMSAVVLNYAYYRTTKEDTHKFIAFINFGQSNLQCVLAWLTPKDDLVQILATESEQIGGRDFDQLLAEHFVKEHKLTLTPKSYLKLVFSCEKLKRLLSANANEIPLHVESLISEDKDFTGRIDRATFESLSEPILQRVEACFKRTLENGKANFEKIIAEVASSAKAAEVARGVQAAQAVEAARKAEAAKAIKQVEVAKAAEAAKAAAETAKQVAADAAAAAKEANGGDTQPAEGSEEQAKESKDDTSNKESTKETPMETESEDLAKATAEEAKASQLAKQAKAAEKAMASQANRLTKLAEVKFDLQVVEMVGGSIRIPAIKQLAQNVFNLTPSTTLNTDEAVARGCVLHCATLHPGMKVKREVKIMGSESFFTKPDNSACDKDKRRIELELITSDIKYKSRTEARNNLEEYIYSERSKLQEGDQFLNQLSTTLDWLFSDEGEEAPEEEYNTRLNELKKGSEARLVENNNK